MESKYYNNWEFQQLLSLTKTNPFEAKIRYEQYLEKYPDDYPAYPYYIALLIRLQQLEEAQKVLYYIEKEANENKRFNNISIKKEIFKDSLTFTKIKLLSYQKKHDQVIKICEKHKRKLKDIDLNSIIFYCKKQLGMLDETRRDYHSYLFKQIVKYEESDFLEHIKEHQADYNQDKDQPNTNIFLPNFPINEVIEETKKYIPSNKGLFPGFFENVYIFRYDSCGKENNKLVNYFKVICFHDTKDYITMVPSSGCEYLPYEDLNYLVKEEAKFTRKRQIDKFNQKYGLK